MMELDVSTCKDWEKTRVRRVHASWRIESPHLSPRLYEKPLSPCTPLSIQGEDSGRQLINKDHSAAFWFHCSMISWNSQGSKLQLYKGFLGCLILHPKIHVCI